MPYLQYWGGWNFIIVFYVFLYFLTQLLIPQSHNPLIHPSVLSHLALSSVFSQLRVHRLASMERRCRGRSFFNATFRALVVPTMTTSCLPRLSAV